MENGKAGLPSEVSMNSLVAIANISTMYLIERVKFVVICVGNMELN